MRERPISCRASISRQRIRVRLFVCSSMILQYERCSVSLPWSDCQKSSSSSAKGQKIKLLVLCYAQSAMRDQKSVRLAAESCWPFMHIACCVLYTVRTGCR